ncbi:MAG: NAD(P)-dependent oxidoreductase [Bauldia sp.]|nr:NAD(P)-dependent oxidoreductase [Bauldia sp.]
MKHVIIGGDGFVGRHLARQLVDLGETVVIADIARSPWPVYEHVTYLPVDVTDAAAVATLPIEPGDAVYNLSAKMLSPIQTRAKRHDFFWPVNYRGAENVMKAMAARGVTTLVHFTTDMVYGHTFSWPQDETHATAPLGEYGESKLATERLAETYREQGLSISIFRPRLIIGPGRLGILSKLFKLIDRHLPVPMIGSGRNPYQFISVHDCASACVAAWRAGFPNEAYNLGSDDPPSVRELLGGLIEEAKSRSFLLPTPAWAVKATLNLLDRLNMPIMDPEQYMIADEYCLLDTTKAKTQLGWRPLYDDTAMLRAAYREYRAGLAKGGATAAHAVPAE